jgi:hypothetical protein
MNANIVSLFGDWRHLVEEPVLLGDVKRAVEKGSAFVRADLVASPGILNQGVVDSIRESISELIEMPVVLEFSTIPETIVRSTDAVTGFE